MALRRPLRSQVRFGDPCARRHREIQTFRIVDAIGMACGRNLLGGENTNTTRSRSGIGTSKIPPRKSTGSISAILLHYEIDFEDIRDRLFVKLLKRN